MSGGEPFAVHRLANGWEIREFHAISRTVFCEAPANPENPHVGELGRFVVQINRRHHSKRLSVIHLIGSTPEDHARSLGSAMSMASRPGRFPFQGLWARRKDPACPGKFYYQITLGDAVDEVKAFQSLTLSLKSDDEIDQVFQSIVEQIGVSAP